MDPAQPLSTIKTAWQQLKAGLGIKYRLHDCRHTLLSELAEADTSELKMQAIAGHASKEMLMRYSHMRMDSLREALEKAKKRRPEAEKSEANGKAYGKVADLEKVQ